MISLLRFTQMKLLNVGNWSSIQTNAITAPLHQNGLLKEKGGYGALQLTGQTMHIGYSEILNEKLRLSPMSERNLKISLKKLARESSFRLEQINEGSRLLYLQAAQLDGAYAVRAKLFHNMIPLIVKNEELTKKVFRKTFYDSLFILNEFDSYSI